MERFIVGKDYNIKDWFVYDNKTERNICWCDTEQEAKRIATLEYVKNRVVEIGGNEHDIEQIAEEVIEGGFTTTEQVDFHLRNYYL